MSNRQLPASFVIGELIGSSQSYANAVALVTSPSDSHGGLNSYLKNYRGDDVFALYPVT